MVLLGVSFGYATEPPLILEHCKILRSAALRVSGNRRRPFLIRALENTLVKLILSLEFYSQDGRQKIAMGALLCPPMPEQRCGRVACIG